MISSLIRGQRLVVLFLLGCLLFNYPLLYLFNSNSRIFGIPLLVIGLIIPIFMMRGLFKSNEIDEPCPNCGQRIKTSDATLQLRCPGCHKVIDVREEKFSLAE